MYEISTSILNAEKGKEAEIILALEKARTDYIHIDVMDGEFVEKNTYKKKSGRFFFFRLSRFLFWELFSCFFRFMCLIFRLQNLFRFSGQ